MTVYKEPHIPEEAEAGDKEQGIRIGRQERRWALSLIFIYFHACHGASE